MREKKWVDCPACGAKGSMARQTGRRGRFNPSGYSPLEITDLDGQFCRVCGEGFWSLRSERRIAQSIAEHKAAQDSKRIVASEIASVQEAARLLRMTSQGVHKMMEEGRLAYVIAAGHRFPIRKDLKTKATRRRAVSTREYV